MHLWDACGGTLRCSYRGYNEADEVTAAYSLAFTPDGARIYAGWVCQQAVCDALRSACWLHWLGHASA